MADKGTRRIMRIMGLDLGAKTCGVSLSDELFITAQPLEIIRRERPGMLRRTLARIEALVREYGVVRIVLGLPLNMDDTEGERAAFSREFAAKLEARCGVPVALSDERLTTVEADELMDEMGIPAAERASYVDMLAANVILQEYMENHREELRNGA